MKTPVIKLSHIYKSFFLDDTKIDILKDVSLEINKGDFVAIMGPSGSGKSTLMYIIGCLDRPTSGKVILEGEDLTFASEDKLAGIRNRKMGFVFQMFNLLKKTSALANVLLPVIYVKKTQDLQNNSMKEAKNRAKELLDRVGLSSRLDHFPSQMSGGEQQRVAIARALINKPSIILADEPTGNLDSKTGLEIMDILAKLHQDGNTIIVVTHNQHIADFAHKIIKIYDGRVVGNN